MYINTTGLILRETAYKDSSKILTILTGTEGKLTVSARGALRRNSKLAAATQLLVFSEMTLFSSRDRWTMTEARSIEQFSGLRSDIVLLSLGSYFAELIEAVADEDSPSRELLPLCLNALYALSEGIKEPEYVKPVFEMRLMASSGFAPLLSHCATCGSEEMQRAYLDLSGGTIQCGDCAADSAAAQGGSGCATAGGALLNDAAPNLISLSGSALSAARYAIGCDPKKLFSFTLGKSALREIYTSAEMYLLTQLDRRFRTLDFYKEMESGWTL
jgi:DNA repair protein RecO (recombination protein O)